jgi:hypothetical protein
MQLASCLPQPSAILPTPWEDGISRKETWVDGKCPNCEIIDLTKLEKTNFTALTSTKPTIAISSPQVSRGMKLKESCKSIIVKGKATYENGIIEVLVNGNETNVQADGSFSANVLLAVSYNSIMVRH